MSNQITRKQFVQRLAIASGVGMVGTLPGLKSLSRERVNNSGLVKISPVPGKHYTKSTLKFMSDARFENARHAIRGMGNQNIEFFLEHV
jgi:cysteine synthase